MRINHKPLRHAGIKLAIPLRHLIQLITCTPTTSAMLMRSHMIAFINWRLYSITGIWLQWKVSALRPFELSVLLVGSPDRLRQSETLDRSTHSGNLAMLPNREKLLCHYRYDPLDRLVGCTPSAQDTIRRFYLKDRLSTEIQGAVQRSIMQHDDQLLAQQQRQSGAVETRMLVTDQQRSVLNVLSATQQHPLVYTPYGHRDLQNSLLSLLGYNGERPDPVTGCYLLGNGYRAFNPVLMRFNGPDSWSPFGEGGLNAYAYCVGDPVNRTDKTGHVSALGWQWIQQNIKHVVGRGPKVSTLGRLPVLPLPSTQKPIARTAVTQDESVRVIASQQRTIESMQKTIDSQQKTITSQQRIITSQQKNIDSAQQSIQIGRTVVSDYQEVLVKQGELIADLREDLAFSVHLNASLPTGIHTRTFADVDAAYGQHSLPSQIRSIQPNNSGPQRNAAIRHT